MILYIFSQIIYTLIFLIAFVGNILVIYVLISILRDVTKRSSLVLRCITQITLADFMFTLSMPFLISSLTSTGWPFGSFLCRYYLSTSYLPIFAKAFLMSTLGIICYAIHQGYAYGMTSSRITLMFTLSWIASALICLPIFFIIPPSKLISASAGSTGMATYITTCNVFWPENLVASDTFVLIYTICVFITPLVILIQLSKLRYLSPHSEEDLPAVKSLIKIALASMLVHLILLFPYLIGQIILNYARTAPGYLPKWKVAMSLTSGWIWFMSPAVFPYLYYRFIPEITDSINDTIENIGKLRVNYSSLSTSGPGSIFITRPMEASNSSKFNSPQLAKPVQTI